jgi:hypothetical protein
VSSLEANFYNLLERLESLVRSGGYFVWLEEDWLRIDYINYDWNLDWIQKE